MATTLSGLNVVILRESGLCRTVWSRGKAPVEGLERNSPEAGVLYTAFLFRFKLSVQIRMHVTRSEERDRTGEKK